MKSDPPPLDDTTEKRVLPSSGPPGSLERGKRDSLMNRVIAGRYEITTTIGNGGMGTVYAAKQRGLQREVAVKVLQRDLRLDPETVARFHREAHTMSLLVHPNSVRVFDFGETDDGRLYLVMELLKGQVLTKTRFVGEEDGVVRAVRVARQILGSLAEAHSKGIVHRDLKPDNIFLADVEGNPEPVVKVLDFGIAKIIAGELRIDQLETQHGTVFGTPRFMSPEQAQGKPLDGRSDLYTVGCLLYEMLTGKAPFRDPDAIVVMAKHIRELPPSIRDMAPGEPITPELEAVVMRALEKEPAARFQVAEEFIDALDAAVPEADMYSRRRRRYPSSTSIEAPVFAEPPSTVVDPEGPEGRRRRRTQRTVALLGGIALLGGAALWWVLHDSRGDDVEAATSPPAPPAPAAPVAAVPLVEERAAGPAEPRVVDDPTGPAVREESAVREDAAASAPASAPEEAVAARLEADPPRPARRRVERAATPARVERTREVKQPAVAPKADPFARF